MQGNVATLPLKTKILRQQSIVIVRWEMCLLFMKALISALIYQPNVADSSFPCVSQFVDVGTMVSPTVFARRSLCYLMCDQPDAALRDAMQAQIVSPDWPTAFYMQSVALSKLNMQSDAVDMLNEASELEEKRQKSTKGP